MKKKLVNRFLGLIMTGTLILTSAVSPMAAEITVFTEEGTQSEENSYSDFSVTDDEDDSFVTIEEEPEESEEEIAIESDDGTNEKSETDDIFSDSESEEVTEFADAETRTPEKALTALYDAFNNYKIGTALAFPYGTGEGQYTNAKAFIQAEIEKIVPKSEYDVQFNYTGTLSGASGKETTMDTASLDIAPVHAAADTKPGFTGVTFSIGDKVSSKINLLYLAVKPLEVTAQEAVAFEAEQINFTFAAISTESIRVLPEGESGNVTTSTFTFFKIWAASKSFSSSALTGGASSTAISFFCFGAPSGLRKNPPGRTPETSRVSKTPADAPGFWTVSSVSVNFKI